MPEGTPVIFEDETNLLYFPPLQAKWVLRGHTSEVEICGWNGWRAVYGALDVKNGDRHFLVRSRQRAREFGEFLQTVREAYGKADVAMLLDEASAHTAKASQHLAEQLNIELLWLPVRCPELNPMERLWRKGKSTVCANRQYGTLEEQTSRFIGLLSGMSAKQTLGTAGVLSPNFWIFG